MKIEPYSIAIGGATPVTAESLGLAIQSMRAGNMQPGEATLVWRPCHSIDTGACPVQPGDAVTIWRGGGLWWRGLAGPLRQQASAAGNEVAIPIPDFFSRMARRQFMRGQWWPVTRYPYGYTPPGGAPQPDWTNHNNEPRTWMYEGHRWTKTTFDGHSWDFKEGVLQTLPQMVEELFYYLQTVEAEEGGEVVTLGAFSTGPQPLQPARFQAGPMDCLKWLVTGLKPQPDAWVRVAPGASGVTASCGRFADMPPLDLGEDVLGWGVARVRDQAAGMVSGSLTTQEAGDFTDPTFCWPGGTDVDGASAPRWCDLDTLPLLFPAGQAGPAGWLIGVGEMVGASLITVRHEGQIAVNAHRWLDVQPGARVLVNGQALNVQSATLEAGADRVTLTCGLPRALGLSDAATMATWLARNR